MFCTVLLFGVCAQLVLPTDLLMVSSAMDEGLALCFESDDPFDELLYCPFNEVR